MTRTEEHLIEIQSSLRKWNTFVRELPVPSDLVPAISTGRLELLKLCKPRPLNADECDTLYNLIGGLLETNLALQQHSALVADIATEINRSLNGLERQASRLESYGNFREPMEDD